MFEIKQGPYAGENDKTRFPEAAPSEKRIKGPGVKQEFVPVNTPLLNGNEAEYLAECVRTGWISSEGPFITRFEEAMADIAGRRHGIAVTNGSVALDIAVHALRLEPGDEVIIPTFTIISCAAAVVRAGLIPVVGRLRSGDLEHDGRRRGSRDHAAHPRDHAGAHLRSAGRSRSDPRDGAQA